MRTPICGRRCLRGPILHSCIEAYMSCCVLAMFVGFWCDTAGIPNPGEEEHSTFGLHVAVPRSGKPWEPPRPLCTPRPNAPRLRRGWPSTGHDPATGEQLVEALDQFEDAALLGEVQVSLRPRRCVKFGDQFAYLLVGWIVAKCPPHEVFVSHCSASFQWPPGSR